MKKLLITGGTVFVSRFAARYFVQKGYDVTVLNRNTRRQEEHVKLVCGDRTELGDRLKDHGFDAVIDICAYNGEDVRCLLDALGSVKDYILISSSAVYPETNEQPFEESQQVGENSIWGAYGTNKIEAERYLQSRIPQAYILRPPYLYGPMQNIYREPFIFDCAKNQRPFYIPGSGSMKLQFFHVEDLCKMIELLMEQHPQESIINVGNERPVDLNEFVELCYRIVGEPLEKVYVKDHENQRDYFCFHDYEYQLNVSRQAALLPKTKGLEEGLRESYEWYIQHEDTVKKKDYFGFIDRELADQVASTKIDKIMNLLQK